MSIVLRKYWIRDELSPLRGLRRGEIAFARIVVGLPAEPAGLVVPSATPLTRHPTGERLGVRARSVLGGLHHEYLLAPASA